MATPDMCSSVPVTVLHRDKIQLRKLRSDGQAPGLRTPVPLNPDLRDTVANGRSTAVV